eukprot:4605182-Amphidinium_carterae.1
MSLRPNKLAGVKDAMSYLRQHMPDGLPEETEKPFQPQHEPAVPIFCSPPSPPPVFVFPYPTNQCPRTQVQTEQAIQCETKPFPFGLRARRDMRRRSCDDRVTAFRIHG